MVRINPSFYRRIIVKTVLIGAIIVISINLSIIGVIGNGESDQGKIAVFYGSSNDKKLCEEMVKQTERVAVYYDIAEIQADTSFIFNNESIAAIWWVSELPLPIDFSFLDDINVWKQTGKGIFITNRYFNATPLQELAHLGITAYAPVVYPLNGSFTEQELQLVESQLSMLSLTQTSFSFNGSTAWIKVDNQKRMLAEIVAPQEEELLGNLNSGIWLVDSRVIVSSFAIEVDSNLGESEFILQGVNLDPPEDVISLLAQLAQLTLEDLPATNNASLQFGDVDQLVAMGLIAISSIIAVIAMIKMGVIARIRDIIVGIFTGLFLFIAHVAYSPQRRRISESELLDNELRFQIVDHLEKKGEQGAHLREIQREIGCGISSLLWHLQALDDFNLVTHEKIGKYHIFYLTGTKSVQTTEIALALKSEVAKELCRVLIKKKKPLTLSKISQEIDVHHSSVQHHIKRLGELGIIVPLQERKRTKYIIGPKRLPWLRTHLEVA